MSFKHQATQKIEIKKMNWLQQFNPRKSLRAHIGLASGVLALVLSLVVSFIAAENSKRQIQQTEGQSFARRATAILDVLDRGMFERTREIQNAASLDEIREHGVPVARQREILEQLQNTFNAYAWIGICDANGIGAVGTGKYLEGKDLNQRPWCSKGRIGNYVGDMHDALLLSKLLPNPSGDPFYLLDVAAPVRDKMGVLQGVLCGHIFWRWAEEALDSKKSQGKDIFLLSKDGLVLSGPETARTDLAKVAPLTMQAIQNGAAVNGYLLEHWVNGKTYLVGWSKSSGYRGYAGLGWLAVMREDVTQAFAPAVQLQQRILLMGLGFGLLFAWLGWVMAGRIVRPIAGISAAADKIAAGDLSYDAPAVPGDGEVAHLSAAIHDMVEHLTLEIAQRKRAEEALRIAATAFESQQGMIVTDANRVILRVNPAFTAITGYSAEESVGQNPSMLSSGRHDQAFYAAMSQTLERDGTWAGEIWNQRKNGEVYPEWLTVSAVRDGAAAVTHYVGIFTDVSERLQAQTEIDTLAFYDPLTKLPNRRLLLDRLDQALLASTRHSRKSALLFVDLDNFKTLNDTLGHHQGDRLLTQVAQRLKGCIRDGDTVARLGSDEFVVMLEDLSENLPEAANQAEAVADKVLNALAQDYPLASGSHHSTTSIGITLFGGAPLESNEEPLKRAELAMFQAKAAGRNALRFFDTQMQAEVSAHAALEADLRLALPAQQLLLHYQPQVVGTDRATARTVGVEALVRWQHPQRGLVPPASFIPLAEETGLILPIGQWVLETACAQLTAWAANPALAHLTMAVNVSARQFSQPDFVDSVLTTLARTGAKPKLLKLELTESMLVDDVENIISKMAALKVRGVAFSLDDFGTGYSSLAYLKRLPLNQLKIDQGFVRNIVTDANDAALAKMVVVLAESMGLTVIAEGVELQAQADLLAHLGCHAYQGYWFSRPLALAAFEAFVLKTA